LDKCENVCFGNKVCFGNVLSKYDKLIKTTGTMFEFFKRKSETRMLHQEYRRLIAEAHKLISTDRYRSDEIYMEAVAIMDKIHELESAQ